MTPSERLEKLISGEKVDRPPFMPAIYDLKPTFVRLPSHTFGQNKQEIIDTLTFEAEQLDADSLTVGYDIYNIEAEAVGCAVLRDPGIWMPEIAGPIVHATGDFHKLKAIDRISGRMGIFVQAAQTMLEKYDSRIPVRGGISGPFSMATKLFPEEKLLMETVMNPGGLIPLLKFCTETIKIYARAFADVGAGVVVFDSYVSPPMISPRIYHEQILPFHQEIFRLLEDQGVHQRSLIIGGNTLPIINDIVLSGATQFLLDFSIPMEAIETTLQEYPEAVFRVNLPPAAFALRNTGELTGIVDTYLRRLTKYGNVIIGTGILPPEVPASNIRAAKDYIVNFYN